MDTPTEPALSGAVFLRNVEVFRDVVGLEPVERAFASLPLTHRRELEAAVPAAWIGVTAIDALYTAIAQEAGEDLQTLYPDIVRVGISRTLRSVWRALLRLTTDRALLRRTPLIYAKGHSVGKIEATIEGRGRGMVVLTGWPNMPALRRLGVAAGIRATMEVAGRADVVVDYVDTADGAEYRVRWRP